MKTAKTFYIFYSMAHLRTLYFTHALVITILMSSFSHQSRFPPQPIPSDHPLVNPPYAGDFIRLSHQHHSPLQPIPPFDINSNKVQFADGFGDQEKVRNNINRELI